MSPKQAPSRLATVTHEVVDVDGVATFYRHAGPPDAPVVLLPHGYPCSSYAYRNLMPLLGDRWRLVAPDAPGFGYSATPDPAELDSTFDAYAQWLERFADELGLDRYALYLHDYGSQFELRLALHRSEQVTALIIQNGDIYEDTLGPRYDWLKTFWANPTPEGRQQLAHNVSAEGFRDDFLNGVPPQRAARFSPDMWTLHWALMNTPQRRRNVVNLFEDQATTLAWFPTEQTYLRDHQPPTLIVWGTRDGYMPEKSARAYLRDQPCIACNWDHYYSAFHPAETKLHVSCQVAGRASAGRGVAPTWRVFARARVVRRRVRR
jgi:pimeloyl-ACP methyl ester carboxylesterase